MNPYCCYLVVYTRLGCPFTFRPLCWVRVSRLLRMNGLLQNLNNRVVFRCDNKKEAYSIIHINTQQSTRMYKGTGKFKGKIRHFNLPQSHAFCILCYKHFSQNWICRLQIDWSFNIALSSISLQKTTTDKIPE